ncbi:MAG: EAL domain-containing protein, partial [Gammaproteobacteria bacterium]
SEMNEGPYTLCYLDLDQFKLINDTSGHIAGDQLLKEVAGILQACVRKTDTLARLGGDEFGLLLSGYDLDQAIQLADTVLKHLNESSFHWDDKQFRITASIGIVSVSGNEGTMEEILSAADTACYIAKESGRNRAHVHTIDDSEVAYRRNEMLWVERIYKALDEDRFALHFQPIHPINGHGSGERFFEALLRLNNDQGPPTCPATFIPAAERFGAMPRLDRWVLGKAAATLRVHGNENPPVCLSVNLSGHSLGDEGFLAFAYDLMRDTQIADRLCFEITETAAIANLAQARSFIHEMKQLGCRFALDDFGSGLSSFQYLKNLHVDYLKIEGSFVSSLLNDPIDLAMVRSINEVGHAIGLQTIAEYVESAEILQTLRELGVDYAQGFHIGHPVENLTLVLTHST